MKTKLSIVLLFLLLVMVTTLSLGQVRTPLKNAYLQTDLNGNGKDILSIRNLTATGTIDTLTASVDTLYATNIFGSLSPDNIAGVLTNNIQGNSSASTNAVGVINTVLFTSSTGRFTNKIGLLDTTAFTNAVAGRIPIILGVTTYYITLSTNVP